MTPHPGGNGQPAPNAAWRSITSGHDFLRHIIAGPHTRLARRIARSLLSLILAVLAGGFIASALVRYSPGFDIDENSWNPQISAATLAAMHVRREYENRLPRFYARYLARALRGDLGESDSFHVPVTELLRHRAGVTAELMATGVAGGMLLGGALAWLAVWPRRSGFEVTAVTVSGLLLAVPPAVLGLAFFLTSAPLGVAVVLAILPRVFGTLRALWGDLYNSGALLAARARGMTPWVLAWRYVLRPAASQLIALGGVALVMAFGVLIPVEAICDVPGIGQLTWQAANSRDLPLLCGLALIITLVVASVAAFGDFGDLIVGGEFAAGDNSVKPV
jgi:peptide/nickel transport system permease protein